MARDVRERVIVATTLDRDDIIAGLRELIAELRADGEVVGIRLVGGAALSLRYFDRGSTQDLDSLHVPLADTRSGSKCRIEWISEIPLAGGPVCGCFNIPLGVAPYTVVRE